MTNATNLFAAPANDRSRETVAAQLRAMPQPTRWYAGRRDAAREFPALATVFEALRAEMAGLDGVTAYARAVSL